MASVVCEPCQKCPTMGCLTVCPVDCFHEGQKRLVIDPLVCIDCGACQPECPHKAIYCEEDVPEKWKIYIAINKTQSQSLPLITEPKS